MALKAALIMSAISIAMLAIYGADVISAGQNADESGKSGFLGMDASVRGSIFGIIPSAMLIASYFITRREPSKKLGIMMIIGGAMIIVGTGIILAIQGGQSQDSRAVREFGAVLAIGVIIAALGGLKLRKSKPVTA